MTVQNIRNTKGSVGCALFDSPEGFPREYLRFASRVAVFKIQGAQARCDFEYIPIGSYAIAVIHDENMNGKFDSNKIGVPTEGYGFSNVAEAKLGAPSFSAARFYFDGGNYDLTISLQY